MCCYYLIMVVNRKDYKEVFSLSIMKNKGILIADDEDSIRNLLSGYLGGMLGYSVKTVGSVDEAKIVIKSPDSGLGLVISDLRMPNKGDGKKLYDFVKSEHPYLDVIMISGTPFDLADEGFSQDVDYLGKPFGLKNIGEKVEKYLGKP